MARALEEPLRQIAENAGNEGSVVVSKVLDGKGDFGFNAKTEEYVNMHKAGIIDPTKVTRIALENAASVAGMILTTECALVDIKEENPPAMPPLGGAGMPGMMYSGHLEEKNPPVGRIFFCITLVFIAIEIPCNYKDSTIWEISDLFL